MMETERLTWLRKNQTRLRVGKYKQLFESTGAANSGTKTIKGTRVVLPSIFLGSKRYMDQQYFDGMTISTMVGFLDVFYYIYM